MKDVQFGTIIVIRKNVILNNDFMENVKRIKCSCGNRFVVTKNDAYKVDVDFSGPDVYYYKCPKCGKHHLVCGFEFRQPTLLQSIFWF